MAKPPDVGTKPPSVEMNFDDIHQVGDFIKRLRHHSKHAGEVIIIDEAYLHELFGTAADKLEEFKALLIEAADNMDEAAEIIDDAKKHIDMLEAVLTWIAERDWRGNKPETVQAAENILEEIKRRGFKAIT